MGAALVDRDESWLRKGRLDDRPDRGFWRGLLLRLGFTRTIHVWGLRFRAPRSVVAPSTRWYLRAGQHEYAEGYAALQTLDRSLPVVEVGAGLGTISCLVNQLLKRPEDHVAIEMNAAVLPHLQRNRDLNGCRFEIVHGAVRYGGPVDPRRTMGKRWKLGAQASAADGVPTIALSEVLERKGWTRVNLILDIEGAEFDALRNEEPVFRDRVQTLTVEIHPWGGTAADSGWFVETILGFGFRLDVAFGAVMSFRRTLPASKRVMRSTGLPGRTRGR